MNESTINFLLVLITGRVWCHGGGVPKHLDFWIDERFIRFLKDNFSKTIFQNEKLKVSRSGYGPLMALTGYGPLMALSGSYSIPKTNKTIEEKKKSGEGMYGG